MKDSNTLQQVPWSIIAPTHIPVACTNNLGDAIQSEAARRLWPSAKCVSRDNPRSWPKDSVVPLVGWYGHHHQPFPTSANTIIVGFHCNPKSARCLKNKADWFRSTVRNQGFPAFCRDIYTRNLLRSVNVDAEFGGCVTLTLKPYDGVRDQHLSIDVTGHAGSDARTHKLVALKLLTPEHRLLEAGKQIDRLGQLASLETSRLHAWLPSLAMGTSAVLKFDKAAHDVRFTGYNIKATKLSELFALPPEGPPRTYRSIEGWFNFEDVYMDIANRLPDNGTFVELGTYAGKSLSFMAEYLAFIGKKARVVGIDRFDRVSKPKVAAILSEGVELIESDSAAAAELFAAGSVDAVFVDADHSAASVAADVAAWLPRLTAQGVMAGHDLSPGHPGVKKGLLMSGISFQPVSRSCWIHDRRGEPTTELT